MKKLPVLFALLLCSSAALAGPTDAEEAYRRGDYAAALKEFTRLATSLGSGDAYVMLAIMYSNGQGVPRDEEKVIEYATKAIERNDDRGYTLLAAIYHSRNSKLRDKEKTLYWLNRGIEAKHPGSMRMLSAMYRHGDMVDKDLPQAFELMKRAYDLEYDALSALELARMYEDGVGVPANTDKAKAIYERAVKGQAAPEAHYRLAMLLEHRPSSGNMERAYRHYEIAATSGNADAMNAMGRMHEKGITTPVNYLKAAVFYEAGANHGNLDALFNGGRLFEKGLGVKQDEREAMNWFSEAATKHHPPSMRRMARYADLGRGQPATPALAASTYCNATLKESGTLQNLASKTGRSAAETNTLIAHGAILARCPALPQTAEQARQRMMKGIDTALDDAGKARSKELAAAMATAGSITVPLQAFTQLDSE